MPSAVLVFILAGLPNAAAVAEHDARPDLDVTHIERTPQYNPIPWVFPEKGPPFQGDPKTGQRYSPAQLKAMKERPAPGDTVTFTVHIVNASDTPAPPFTGEWRIDGKAVKEIHGESVTSWGKTTFEVPWTWAEGAHTVQFVADPRNRITESCEKNNAVADRTDALALQMRVTQQLYDGFRRTPNALGSRSFEDWVQRHILIMNNAFAACVYRDTGPQGILERVRVDEFVIMAKDEMLKRQPQIMGCDGGWNFYDDEFPAWFNGHIAMDLSANLDWGLIHELTHQLGIIDLYTIVVGGHWNHVRGADGQPVWVGYGGSQPCVMSGSGIRTLPDGSTPPPLTLKVDRDGNVTAGEGHPFQAYSEHTAGGLNSLLGKRRGHFGLYLFDIPRRNALRILDNAGSPVAGADVAVYQQTPQPGPQSIGGTPTHSGKTDREGIFELGNRPFGDINTIGLNGILFFAIRARGHTEYRFVDITPFNIAAWQGKEGFTATFRTGIPPAGAPPPVRQLRCALWEPNRPVVLAWEPPLGAEVAHYNVYRVLAPQYHSISFQPRYEEVATVPPGTTRAEVQPPPGYAGVTDVPCFMVTALNAQGQESGHADDRQLPRFAFPGGQAKIERIGESGRTVKVTLGPQGFIHLRESALIEKGAVLEFRFRTNSRQPASLRMAVAGLGEVQVALTGPPDPSVPVLTELKGLNDGSWKQVRLRLRDLLDSQAAQKGAMPAQARTTWNDDWLVTEFRFGHFASPAETKQQTYEFEDLQVSKAGSR